jgi:hypothetical protein
MVRLNPNQAHCSTIGRNNDIPHGVDVRDIGTGMGLEPIWKTAALYVWKCSNHLCTSRCSGGEALPRTGQNLR